jgi:hypothetical protein
VRKSCQIVVRPVPSLVLDQGPYSDERVDPTLSYRIIVRRPVQLKENDRHTVCCWSPQQPGPVALCVRVWISRDD